MIDPMVPLAFSVHTSPGVYALLLGSGISRPADIPTGWDITLDLIRKTAAVQGHDPGDAPAAWYQSTFGKDPDYSELVEGVAPGTGNRRQLLERYFVPTEDERELGKKMPTEAHKSIAQLVAGGFIKVIVTTNFDRLLEQALEAAGVVPQVVATEDQIRGMTPLVHAPCTVIKVHGDYLDTRIRNTQRELERYDHGLDKLLDHVFDDHGLIVCGWSADWDPALRSAIDRCPNRRYAMYWSSRGSQVTGAARELCDRRGALVISNRTGDDFFRDLAEKVGALKEVHRGHPLSPQIAAASLKRYLPEERHRIRLDDLVRQELGRVQAELSSDRFPFQGVMLDRDDLGRRLLQYDATVETFSAMLITGCYHGKKWHRPLWRWCLERIVQQAVDQPGHTTLVDMGRYPALVLAYACGIAAIAAKRYGTFATVLTRGHVRGWNGERDTPLTQLLEHEAIIPREENRRPRLPGPDRNLRVPTSEHLYEVLREPLREYLPGDGEYCRSFDRFEYCFGLVHADQNERNHGTGSKIFAGPVGTAVYRRAIVRDLDAEIAQMREKWPLLRVGLFDGKLARLLEVKQGYDQYLARQYFP